METSRTVLRFPESNEFSGRKLYLLSIMIISVAVNPNWVARALYMLYSIVFCDNSTVFTVFFLENGGGFKTCKLRSFGFGQHSTPNPSERPLWVRNPEQGFSFEKVRI